jgi:hypothetical protein
MFPPSGSGECEVTANALGGRIRTRLRLDLVVPQASDILLARFHPAWSPTLHAPDK